MSRAVAEWIGKHPDEKIPQRVILRVWQKCGGICQLTGRKIRPGDKWQADHVIALINGGENRESNLQIVLTEAHKLKTTDDVAEKAAVNRRLASHIGAKPRPSSFGTPARRNRASAPLVKQLPPRRMGI